MELEYVILKKSSIKEFIINNISRHFYRYLKEADASFLINGVSANTFNEVKENDILTINYQEMKKEAFMIEKPLMILYEDDNYLIVDKEPHLLTIPIGNLKTDSLYYRLNYYFKASSNTVHFLNRLDKETKGLVLVAKNKLAATLIKEFNKVYYAKTKTKLPKLKDRIILPIGKTNSIKRFIDFKDGKESITNYELVEENECFTYKIVLETGRTHQIRLHFSYLGSPIIGDSLYGISDSNELQLVCKEISFFNPFTKEEVKVISEY